MLNIEDYIFYKENEKLFQIVTESHEFALSDYAQTHDVLSIEHENGYSVAHYLATHHASWALTPAAQNIGVLMMRTKQGMTVAHFLASYQKSWIDTPAAKNREVLNLANDSGFTVAHSLASNQKDWVYSESASDLSILTMQDDFGTTVAYQLATIQPSWSMLDIAQSYEALAIKTRYGEPIAITLSRMKSQWLYTPAAADPNILLLSVQNRLLLDIKYEVLKSNEVLAADLISINKMSFDIPLNKYFDRIINKKAMICYINKAQVELSLIPNEGSRLTFLISFCTTLSSFNAYAECNNLKNRNGDMIFLLESTIEIFGSYIKGIANEGHDYSNLIRDTFRCSENKFCELYIKEISLKNMNDCFSSNSLKW
jgi:hypothetical protein